MSLGIGTNNPHPPSNTQALEELLKHAPLSLLVELVEHRYRDRRNKFVITILTAALSLCGASAGLLYRMYSDLPQAAEEVVEEGREAGRQADNKNIPNAESAPRLASNSPRTAQSFNILNGTLEVGQSQPVQLGVGQRHHYLLRLQDEGRYRIVMTNRAPSGLEAPAVPFTPVMYLYQLRQGEPIARPIDTNIGALFFEFSHETGGGDEEDDVSSYFLEVESLLGDAGSFTLALEDSMSPLGVVCGWGVESHRR